MEYNTLRRPKCIHQAENTASEMSSTDSKLVVAAIDFGTTFSGYAFSLRHEHEKDPLCIKVNPKWESGGRWLISHKAPTTVLLNPKKEFHSFGYDAENKYSELSLDGEHHEWYYYRRFKMELYKQKSLSRESEIESVDGKLMPALSIISYAINYLRESLVHVLCNRINSFREDDIFWIITLPAIWSDAAKQFMKEAAVKAGIPLKSLQLCLEPEAASVYCQHIPFERLHGGKGISAFQAGTSYMVLDLGGGTADITVHQVLDGGHIKELQKASGGAWGGVNVDSAFVQFLEKLFSHEVVQTFREMHLFDFLELEREFEMVKRKVKVDDSSKITIRIPPSFLEIFRTVTDCADIKEALETTSYRRRVSITGDKLRMEAGILREMFGSIVDDIIRQVGCLLTNKRRYDINHIIMVGGLSESEYMQKSIQNAFPDVNVMIPEDPELAVMKGAVLFGFNPSIISARVARFTYGTNSFIPFIKGQHPESKKVVMDGRDLCEDFFVKYVAVGDILPINTVIGPKRYMPIRKKQRCANVQVFASSDPDPYFVTDTNSQFIGLLTFQFHDNKGELNRPVLLKMIFGGTELAVEAMEEKTGNTVVASFEFLDPKDQEKNAKT
ncbi:heat shock 70 kDa protein 12A-like [Mytilus trossulus]|uniref:heat shock 70 kDa protein 12A-like n=1 Tax=Mytilus trossulus TaxID=6551 RepID=UPI00300786E5